jgi:hypothetical protein
MSRTSLVLGVLKRATRREELSGSDPIGVVVSHQGDQQ